MRYESIVARFLLVSTAPLWSGVLCAQGRKKPEELPLTIGSASSPRESISFTVPFSSDLMQVAKVQEVRTTLSHLFGNLNDVGKIETDEVLAYYPLLSELSFFKKRYPSKLDTRLIEWPLPKGNLTLSLLISNGPIRESTLRSLVSYFPRMSDKPAGLAVVNYYLDVCAPNSMDYFYGYDNLRGHLEPCVVSRLKRTLCPSVETSCLIASSLLHFPLSELNEALVNDLNEALAKFVPPIAEYSRFLFCSYFISHPVIHRNQNSRQSIFLFNVLVLRAIPFTAEERITLSAINKIKFGSPQVIKDMSEAERKKLFDMFHNGSSALVFHVWAREDAEKDGAWVQFVNDSSYTSALSRLAFGLEDFFQNHFDVDFLKDNDWYLCYLLDEFKNYPSSSKQKHFQELLRAKVQEHSETILALLQNSVLFIRLVAFFIDQGDKMGLMALNGFVFREIINGALDDIVEHPDIIRGCQLLGGRIDGGCIDDPLRLLAERVGAAKVLRELDFYLLRANDMGDVLSTLGISWEKMDAAMSNLRHKDKPEDELAEVLRTFQILDLVYSAAKPPDHQPLWFYLWKEHREAFDAHVDSEIKQHYLPEEWSP